MSDMSYITAFILILVFVCVYAAQALRKNSYRRRLRRSGLDKIGDGRDFEEYVAALLKSNGYRHIRTTPKSGDYGADIIAEKDGLSYAIQCKLYAKAVGVKAVQEIFSAMQYYGCDAAIVATNSRFSRNAVNLAESTGTVLWDRDSLVDMAAKKNIAKKSMRDVE